jgi:dipeptidyl aminopeptidase/acylaminoacyl peptidase
MRGTFLLILLSALTSSELFAQDIPLIPREVFFDNPQIAGGQLSPDGKLMSFTKPYLGEMNIWVKKVNEPFEAAKVVTADSRPIRQYFWSADSKYLLYVQDKKGDENFHLYAVNPMDAPDNAGVPAARDLTDLKNVRAYIYNVSKKDPNKIRVGLNDTDPAWHNLYEIDIASGERKLLRENKDRITDWSFDWDEKLRLAMRTNEDGTRDILRVEPDNLIKIYDCGALEQAYTLSFDRDNKQVYMVSNHGLENNFTRLMLLDPVSGNETLVEADPNNKVDFEHAFFSEASRELLSTRYFDSKPRMYWKNKLFEEDYNLLKSRFMGKEVELMNADAIENQWLVLVSSDNNPGEVHLFDRTTKSIAFQYKSRPQLKSEYLSEMMAITYPSSDGLEIPAYLTIPKGKAAKNLPLMVVPHGGPWHRDYWGFNSHAQFWANRGYAVLNMNFRGSTGYGKHFLDAGNKQWGDKMQDDITYGVRHLIEKGIVNKDQVGITGGSYGGYATLAGVTFTPDLYKVAVAEVAPSNLNTLLAAIPPYWEAERKMLHLRLGDPTEETGKALLEKQSPLNHVSNIKTPLMIIQGANDPRVKKAEADQIVVAMRDNKIPVEYLCASDEGHGFARPVNNMAALAASEKFMAKYLGGRFQEEMTPEVAKRLAEITVDIQTVALAKTQTDAGIMAGESVKKTTEMPVVVTPQPAYVPEPEMKSKGEETIGLKVQPMKVQKGMETAQKVESIVKKVETQRQGNVSIGKEMKRSQPTATKAETHIENMPSVVKSAPAVEKVEEMKSTVTKVEEVKMSEPTVTKVETKVENRSSVPKTEAVVEKVEEMKSTVTKVEAVKMSQPTVTKVETHVENMPSVTKTETVIVKTPTVVTQSEMTKTETITMTDENGHKTEKVTESVTKVPHRGEMKEMKDMKETVQSETVVTEHQTNDRFSNIGEMLQPVSDLAEGTFKYRVIVKAENQDAAIETELLREIKADGNRWKITEVSKLGNQKTSDINTLEKKTLKPVQRETEIGEKRMVLAYEPSMMRSKIMDDAGTREEQFATNEKVLSEGAGLDLILGAMPLQAGLKIPYKTFDAEKQQLTLHELSVSGKETVNVPAGRFEALKVESTSKDGKTVSIYWIAEGKTVKMSKQSPQTNGATVVSELMKD